MPTINWLADLDLNLNSHLSPPAGRASSFGRASNASISSNSCHSRSKRSTSTWARHRSWCRARGGALRAAARKGLSGRPTHRRPALGDKGAGRCAATTCWPRARSPVGRRSQRPMIYKPIIQAELGRSLARRFLLAELAASHNGLCASAARSLGESLAAKLFIRAGRRQRRRGRHLCAGRLIIVFVQWNRKRVCWPLAELWAQRQT